MKIERIKNSKCYGITIEEEDYADVDSVDGEGIAASPFVLIIPTDIWDDFVLKYCKERVRMLEEEDNRLENSCDGHWKY